MASSSTHGSGSSDFGSSPETRAAQALGREDDETGALVPPIHPSTTYARDPDGGYRRGRGYTRADNPTYDAPEDLLTELEGGDSSLLFASGMAAAAAVFQSLLPGDHVLVPRVMYWALRKWLWDFALPWGLDIEQVDMTDPEAVRSAIRPGRTRLVWTETPANPLWEITDLAACADLAHEAGARLAADSTTATPVLTRPLELGADLVVHSATKYLNGHGDVLAGAVVTARRDGFWQRIRSAQRDGGAVLGPFEAWLLLRGMRTLFPRVRQACQSAQRIAERMQAHPAVRGVLYPGLPGHPGHELACRQMRGGFGGMLSIRVCGGEPAAMQAAASVRVFKRATSLGGIESLIEHRASIEGPSTPVPPDLLRLSIGLEDPEDLIADLEAALHEASRVPAAAAGPPDSNASAPGAPAGSAARVFRERIRPVVLDRGGDADIVGDDHHVLTLRMEGSPGALVGLRDWIERTLERAGCPRTLHFEHAQVATPGDEDDQATEGDEPELADRVQQTLEQVVAPAIAVHGGGVRLRAVRQGIAEIELTGRCRGCALAEVTLRQGIEPTLCERFDAIDAVVDVTDHASGRNPYFSAGKSGGGGSP
jgi:cystathionine gamma-synthase